METKKQKLIDALMIERSYFKERGQSTLEHDVAIEYLKTGVILVNPDDFELLDACINDLDILYSDYLTF